jgi:hypothetical protein
VTRAGTASSSAAAQAATRAARGRTGGPFPRCTRALQAGAR